ncbi:HTH-type transcriptional regulator LysM [uncultured archaeon]|nr:HTH-type transcriptional regulator LysM [uncultured archaeon]
MQRYEEFRLDLKDRKILYELDKDCRQTCSQIGKKVGLSSEVVNYRIKKFEEEKIITHYQVVINLSCLGQIEFKVALSLQNIDSNKFGSLLKKVEKIEGVKWIVSCRGNWDMIVSGVGKSLTEINKIEDEVLSIFSGYVLDKSLAVCFKAEVFDRDFLIKDRASSDRERVLVDESQEINLDELDVNILKELAENGRKPIVDIAFKLKESERVINYRIKRLVDRKIITGFRIAVDYNKLGIKFYKTFVYLDNPKKERVRDLIDYFNSNKNIIHNVEVIGNWDLEPEFEVFSEEEFDKLLGEMKDEFSDIIKKVDVLTISQEHKFVYL